ncbi:MAG: pilus assembly protein N-terminal domain-containing protein [Methylobacterium mesophilicum]|nr:pilus assembly protein N-terminal domain-containing protein [Methylobacterium mesophilicum]
MAIPFALCLLAVSSVARAESTIPVAMNQAKLLKLSRPADTIVIGNPAIADASVQDARTLVLTGKGFGVTNVVVLDADGGTIMEQEVVVSRDDQRSVRVYRRASVQTLSCTPYCESSYKSDAERASDSEMGASQ